MERIAPSARSHSRVHETAPLCHRRKPKAGRTVGVRRTHRLRHVRATGRSDCVRRLLSSAVGQLDLALRVRIGTTALTSLALQHRYLGWLHVVVFKRGLPHRHAGAVPHRSPVHSPGLGIGDVNAAKRSSRDHPRRGHMELVRMVRVALRRRGTDSSGQHGALSWRAERLSASRAGVPAARDVSPGTRRPHPRRAQPRLPTLPLRGTPVDARRIQSPTHPRVPDVQVDADGAHRPAFEVRGRDRCIDE